METPRNRRKTRSFSLIEMMTVMAILAVLMAMGLGIYGYATRKAADAKTEAVIAKITAALENYKAKHGYYIQTFSAPGFYLDIVDTTATTGGEVAKNNFCGLVDYEAMKKNDTELIPSASAIYPDRYAVVDGFGMHLIYQCPGAHNRTTFDLSSDGADNTTTDDDIKNW